MSSTRDVPVSDLLVEEVNVTSAVLAAAAYHYGNYCDKPNHEFMLCRYETTDPRKCLPQGRRVSECAVEFFKKVNASCREDFTKHWTCLDHNNHEFEYCRPSQRAYDECMFKQLGLESGQPQK
ncbi:NADH dehydrogenase [ubiquinone] 1 alpha subcomplex subunit 8 [Trichoplax sp. H2]|nr:NADH dehydrogenase [ubiquinone] 1 alpha subcomplex subunit 8 [Trichoplax sp. H2]|eukprot:RDD45692.1 NADH dehydrogenase [ubiquinone] 1 alpha subcomplex subunit 8 [Trichoplax sp. H2]